MEWAAIAGSFKGPRGSPAPRARRLAPAEREGLRARGPWLPVASAAGARVAAECGWLGVRGAEIPGEVGERPTPNRTRSPAPGGAGERGWCFCCARVSVCICVELWCCAPAASARVRVPHRLPHPPSVPFPSLPPSRAPTAASRAKAQGSGGEGGEWGGGRGGVARGKRVQGSARHGLPEPGRPGREPRRGRRRQEEPERPQRRRGKEEPDHGVQVK
ncbi:translation initiation factor IF-2 isoform X2 [Bubalus bubalis]|uniref:translation initiation factor IF-2 isoform X2 n=1 Tax=Bubalus bubalis TaxID=89462 RepID=UPI001E1B81E8|nr:translation initiation factor IF-2 isoform X2 [Bubalus bubalis]